MPRKYDSMQDRIIANSVLSQTSFYKDTPCWVWLGAYKVNRNGTWYPTLTVRFKKGPRKGAVKTELAHRVSLRVFRGRRLMKNIKAMHLCNYSMCVNPMHLAGGTQATNVRQCVADGRHKSGFRRKLA